MAGRRTRRTAIALFLFITYQVFSIYVSTPLKIGSRAMEPALYEGDRLLFSRLLMQAHNTLSRQLDVFGLGRGDLVVIQPPYYRENQRPLELINPIIRFFTFQKMQFSSYSRYDWESPYMVKRVVGLPGDTVRIDHHHVFIRPEGEAEFRVENELVNDRYTLMLPDLPEEWRDGYPLDGSGEDVLLGEDEFFLVSDSRGRGSDSFSWGPLDRSQILGKVFFRYWPFSRISIP